MSQRSDVPKPGCLWCPLRRATYDLCEPCQFRSQGPLLLPNQLECVCSEGLMMVAIFFWSALNESRQEIFEMPRILLAGQAQSIYELSTLAQHIGSSTLCPW